MLLLDTAAGVFAVLLGGGAGLMKLISTSEKVGAFLTTQGFEKTMNEVDKTQEPEPKPKQKEEKRNDNRSSNNNSGNNNSDKNTPPPADDEDDDLNL
jgi:Sec-independent protein translocase protein TatA